MAHDGTPRPSRPRVPPGYGIDPAPPADVTWDDVAGRLVAAHNYWVASVRPNGRPHVMPVWGLWLDGAFWFSTDPSSRKGRNLAVNPQVVVHLESGDDVVVVEGVAETWHDPAQLARFADAYDAKYGIRVDVTDDAFGVYRVAPVVAFAWSERDFPTSAVRWSFDGMEER